MNLYSLILILALLGIDYASAEPDFKKYAPDFAQQYIPDFEGDENPSFLKEDNTDFKQYIPEPYQKYVPDFNNEEDNMEDGSLGSWEEESSSSPQSSSKNKVLYGPSSLSGRSYHNLTGHGPLKLTRVSIAKNLVVNGPLTGSRIRAASLKVNGPVNVIKLEVEEAVIRGIATFKDAQIKNNLTVFGPLLAQKSTFKQTMHIYTSEMHLKDCQTRSIIIEKDNEFSDKHPIVYFSGNTKVAGNIEFKGKKGLIFAGPQVRIEGKVINGDLK